MTTEPKVINRDEQPYVAIRKQVDMQDIPTELPPLIGEVFSWLQHNGAVPAGAPFFRYFSMDPGGKIDVAVGVPVARALKGDGRVGPGSFPAGRYAVLTHTGPYTGLRAATGGLLDWAEKNGVAWQTSEDGTWGARIESYLTDPNEEPNPEKWQTEIAFQIGDS
jgi:effector-binding domain-containing protein